MPSQSKTSRARCEGDEDGGSSSARATQPSSNTASEIGGPEPGSECGRSSKPTQGEGLGRLEPIPEGVAREGDIRWRQLLAGGTPREILCRIVQGDPLGLRDRVAQRLHAEAYLLDADRVQLRALARCARFASRYQGRPDFPTWLDEIVNQAIEDILREDLEADVERQKSASTPGAAFIALALPLGLEPETMRLACAGFNQLPGPHRRAFFELVIQGRSLDELARQHRESASEIARRARRALDLLLQVHATEPRLPPNNPSGMEART